MTGIGNARIDPAAADVATRARIAARAADAKKGEDILVLDVADIIGIVECFVPYDRADVLAALHRAGQVLVEVHDDDGTRVRARLSERDTGQFAEFTKREAV